jgi:tyrosyl-tRNA synthetase
MEKDFPKFGLDKAEFVLGSEIERNMNYMDDVLNLALNNTINRGLRSMQTVARDIENARISQVIYPLMQIVDFKYLKADGALGGIEQRKIHMLALESLKDIDYGPCFFIHHELIPSMKGSDKGKMSSSDKSSLIAITDDKKEIESKLKKAHCPEGEIIENPILQIFKLLIFSEFSEIVVERAEKFGGNLELENYSSLEKEFSKKKIHPLDLKNTCAEYLFKIFNKEK